MTNQYSLSKTLRFELLPVGKTKDLVRTIFTNPKEHHHELMKKDLDLFESYKKVKKLIDCMHRDKINNVLSNFRFTDEELRQLNKNFDAKEGEQEVDDDFDKKDPFVKIREKLAKALEKESKIMFDKKLLNPENTNKDEEGMLKEKKVKNKGKCELEKWVDEADDDYLELSNNKKIDKEAIKTDIQKFKGFFTYFKGFNENRKNVYSGKKIATAIPFRIVNDNFFIFKKNIKNYNKIKEKHPELAKYIDKKGATEIFEINYFNKCLTQRGIDVYNNEKLGIIAKEQGKEQDKGINQIINEYTQKKNKEIKGSAKNGEKPKRIKIAVFDKLKKQILSINKTKSFQFEVFEDTPEIIVGIKKRIDFLTKENDKKSVLSEIKNFIESMGDEKYDLNTIYLNEKSINVLSKKLFNYGRYTEIALEKWYDDKIDKSGTDKRRFLSAKQFSVQLIQDSIGNYIEKYEKNEELKMKYKNKNIIVDYFKNPTITVEYKQNEEVIFKEKDLFDELNNRKKNIEHILSDNYKKDLKEEKQFGGDAEKIKVFLDALLEINYILSPFIIKDKNLQKEHEKDEDFYNEIKRLREIIFEVEILDLYNQTRNYITKKPYKLDKFKLTFDSPSLLDGWDKNKEPDNKSILLIKDNFYYLGVMNKKNNTLFEDKSLDIVEIEEEIVKEKEKLEDKTMLFQKKKKGTKNYDILKLKIEQHNNRIEELTETIASLRDTSDFYNKVEYKYFKDCTTMIPKCSVQVKAVKNHFEKTSKDFVMTSKNNNKFVKDLVISKEIYELNNLVYDQETKKFVKKIENEKRPKKFQKNYLKQSGDELGYRDALKKWIQFCKLFLESYKSTVMADYDYKDIFDKKYDSLDIFYKMLNSCVYKLSKDTKISVKYVDRFVQEGKLYLFRIHNKDFNLGTKGKKNLHTLYWEMLFDEKNLQDVVFKLNGGAELFYREASIINSNVPTHKTTEKVLKKFFKLSDGELTPVPVESIKRLNNYFEGKSQKDKLTETDLKYIDNYSIIGKKDNRLSYKEKFGHNKGITKDERFTVDKIQFHCPITINFKSKNINFINDEVLKYLHKREDVHIIGLDRGERHLIYLVMINKNGEIIENMQFSLNELTRKYILNNKEETQKINYQKLLNEREVNRIEARKNWQTIESIKNLKEGYLSLITHQLSKLMIEKNAIIVMENLNYGFKDSRTKVEKQIYQKFEIMFIKKLQYLVLHKDDRTDEAKKKIYDFGGIMKGYQLTNQKVPSYKSIGKQNGFLFYVPPDYTSKIDPVTGFVNLIDTKYYNRKGAIALFEKFDKIYYDKTNHYFRFDFDYNSKDSNGYKNFDKLRVDVNELTRTKWSVCSHPAKRSIVVQENNKWIYRPISDVNDKLIKLFESKNINYLTGECLKEDILKVGDAKFFEDLLKYLYILLSLRHTYKENDVEYDTIVSSVEKIPHSNEFFVSENTRNNLPKNADANGAYNIARKGLWLLNQLNKIEESEEAVKEFNNLKKPKIKIENVENSKNKKTKLVSQWCPNKEWLAFIQN